jgi:hypothetical protein
MAVFNKFTELDFGNIARGYIHNFCKPYVCNKQLQTRRSCEFLRLYTITKMKLNIFKTAHNKVIKSSLSADRYLSARDSRKLAQQ